MLSHRGIEQVGPQAVDHGLPCVCVEIGGRQCLSIKLPAAGELEANRAAWPRALGLTGAAALPQGCNRQGSAAARHKAKLATDHY